jgi:hypothetical protein
MRRRHTTRCRYKTAPARRNIGISASANVPPTNENKSLDLAHIIGGPLTNTGPLLRIRQQQPHKPALRAEAVVDQLPHDASCSFKLSA